MRLVIAHETFRPDDAVGHDIIEEYECLKREGIDVHIFAENYGSDVESLVAPEAESFLKDPSTALIYHHSIYWENGQALLDRAKGKVGIKYHNITPSHFFVPYSDIYFWLTLKGREQTLRIAKSDEAMLMADSRYNAKDFLLAGYPDNRVAIIPPFNKIHDFDGIIEDKALLDNLKSGGKANVLFVGRIAPNKGYKHLILTAYYYKLLFGSNIKFHFVGGLEEQLRGYQLELRKLISKLRLDDVCEFTGKVSMQELKSYYLGADVFLCLSEHEGFCVPILEAQYFRCPIVAHSAGAVGDTIGEGQLVYSEIDYPLFASAIQEIISDGDSRRSLVENGWDNFQKYEKDKLERVFLDGVEALQNA